MMKKLFVIMLATILAVGVITGCTRKNNELHEDSNVHTTKGEEQNDITPPSADISFETVFSGDLPKEFVFSSGVGGWQTIFTLKKDGTFVGSFNDSNMGETSDDYPNGTIYLCEFEGEFSLSEKISENEYSIKLEKINTKDIIGGELIRDGVRYVAASAYGLDGDKNFTLYTPNTPLDTFPKEFFIWCPSRFRDDAPETLDCYGICNKADETAFFSALKNN